MIFFGIYIYDMLISSIGLVVVWWPMFYDCEMLVWHII